MEQVMTTNAVREQVMTTIFATTNISWPKNSFTPSRAIQSVSSNIMGKGQHDPCDKTTDNSGSILRQV